MREARLVREWLHQGAMQGTSWDHAGSETEAWDGVSCAGVGIRYLCWAGVRVAGEPEVG